MMYVSANEKAVSLNVHRYAVAHAAYNAGVLVEAALAQS
jgi:hypothetical protein